MVQGLGHADALSMFDKLNISLTSLPPRPKVLAFR